MADETADRVSLNSLQGTWRRRWIRRPHGRADATSAVFWVQGALRYGDIRIPAGRPSFAGVGSLAECSDAQLRWLATQQGFAGELTESDGVFHWRRDVDAQPPTGRRDAGRLRYVEGGTVAMIEDGADEPYSERWERIDDARGGPFVETSVALQTGGAGRGGLVAAGRHFLLALDRRPVLPVAESLRDLFEGELNADARRQLLDVEISFGVRAADGLTGTILVSTFPWREGQSVALEELTYRTSQATRNPTLSSR
jgi:hypothetical protein